MPVGVISRDAANEFMHEQSVMLIEYFPVLLFILIGVAFGFVPLLAGKLVGPSRPDPEKLSPYECGFEAFEDARMKFDVRYYLVAILFILFDLEIAFLFPWAIVLEEIGMFGFVGDDDFPRHIGGRLHLRVEKRRPGLGMKRV
jgi:NADH-quinone oxidoreductase subunit A